MRLWLRWELKTAFDPLVIEKNKVLVTWEFRNVPRETTSLRAPTWVPPGGFSTSGNRMTLKKLRRYLLASEPLKSHGASRGLNGNPRRCDRYTRASMTVSIATCHSWT